MLKLRHIVLTICTAACCIAFGGSPATPDNSTEARANRFFNYREWINAGALYTMLLGDHPTNTLYCSRAIVSAGMLGDTLQQAVLTNGALDAHIPVDSLFTSVERTSFSVGQTSLYEEYLLRTKRAAPWLARVVDGYLMRYYAFRRNPEGMISYSRIMLEGNPESEPFLYTLAQGYLIDGKTDEAIDTYRRIVSLNPRSLEALLYLANYHDQLSAADPQAADEALLYFRQAQSISPTPFVEKAIERLEKITRKK